MAEKLLFKFNWSSVIQTAAVGTEDTTFDIQTADATLLGSIGANEKYTAAMSNGVDLEVVYVIGVSSATLTVERAKDDTDALTYVQGDTIWIPNTVTDYETFVQRNETDFMAVFNASKLFNYYNFI